MSINLSQTNNSALSQSLYEALIRYLPPFLRLYHELALRADPADHIVTCHLQELAKALKIERDQLRHHLQDLELYEILTFLE